MSSPAFPISVLLFESPVIESPEAVPVKFSIFVKVSVPSIVIVAAPETNVTFNGPVALE